jgi:hypothetical protein
VGGDGENAQMTKFQEMAYNIVRAISKSKVQMPNKAQSSNDKI